MEPNAKIYVAGHRGLVGSALMRNLRARGFDNLLTRTHAELDLTRQAGGPNICMDITARSPVVTI
jgi:GDP-L-fucose synthase